MSYQVTERDRAGPMVYYDPARRKIFKATVEGFGTKRFEGQIVTPGDISTVEAVVILDEVLGRARPAYKLRALCRPISMLKLVARIDVHTALAGKEKVPPMVEAEISKEDYTPVSFDLWKNVCHVAVSDEAGMKAAHDVLGLSIDGAAADLPRMENKQIKEIAEACTEKVAGTVYSDWGAMTNGVSDTNPMVAIGDSMNYIAGKGYPPTHVAMHPTLWNKFINNTHIRGLVTGGIIDRNLQRISLPGYPTVQVIVDWQLTETPTASLGPLVLSQSAPALVLGNGPTTAARYRNEGAGYDAYMIRQWLQPQIVLDDAIDKICT